CLVVAFHALHIIRVYHIGPVHLALDLLLAKPAEPFQLVVRKGYRIVFIQDHHGRSGMLHGGTIFGFTGTKGLLSLSLLGYVAYHILGARPSFILDDGRGDLKGTPLAFLAA